MHVSDNGRYLVDDGGTPYHVRKAAYSCMLSGALGHTYGCRDVQTFYVPSGEPPRYDVDTWWKQALDFPGAYHMGILKRLLTDYPWYELVPDQEHRVIAGGEFAAERLRHVPAAVSADGRFALLYVPHEMRVCVNMDVIARGPVTARWFNPRNGTCQFIGEAPNEGVQHTALFSQSSLAPRRRRKWPYWTCSVGGVELCEWADDSRGWGWRAAL